MSAFTPIPQHKAPPDPDHAFRVIRIVHAAFCGPVFIYGAVVYLILSSGTIPAGGFAPDFANFELFRPILWLMGEIGVGLEFCRLPEGSAAALAAAGKTSRRAALAPSVHSG